MTKQELLWRIFTSWVALGGSNFIWATWWRSPGAYSAARERTFFQFVAAFVIWLAVRK